MSELKPCPFCGGVAKHSWPSGPCWIECAKCFAVGPNNGDTTTEQNEAAWNNRTAPSETAALRVAVEALEACSNAPFSGWTIAQGIARVALARIKELTK